MDSILSIEEIRGILPHRYPFLLIDRVTDIDESAGTIKGYKNITANEPVFNGHFPERSVFPGVLIIEAMAQLGAVYMLKKLPEKKRLALFAGIDRARFKRVVAPGDRLDFELKLLRERGNFAVVEGKAFVEGQLAAEAVLMSSLGK